MKLFQKFILVCFLVTGSLISMVYGQESNYNPISTAVPFLTITPDARSSSLGDVGAATAPDANSLYMNPSKYALIDSQYGMSVSYNPLFRTIVKGVHQGYFSGYSKIGNGQAIGASFRYFTMGEIVLTGVDQTNMGTVRPREIAFDVSYSRKFFSGFSGGLALRYIRSDLNGGFGGTQAGAETYSPGNAVSADFSGFYTHSLGGLNSINTIAAGVNISNIGSKISYNQGSTKEFLPANIKIGTTLTSKFAEKSSFAISLDLNKLLVPTPKKSYDGTYDNGSNKSVINSIFSSLSDAPGGMKEELQEVSISAGAELWLMNILAIRTGYFSGSESKGIRKYITSGVGVKINIASLDFSYYSPTEKNATLPETYKITLMFNIGSFYPGKY